MIPAFLKDTTVLIIGGSDHPITIPPDVDLVVRTNGHYLRQHGPCDILFHNCCNRRELIRIIKSQTLHKAYLVVGNNLRSQNYKLLKNFADKNAVQHDCFPFVLTQRFPRQNGDFSWVFDLVDKYNFRPYTGIFAIEYMRQAGCSKIYTSNMTLYADTKDLRDIGKRGPHVLAAQAQYLLDIEQNTNIQFNPELLEVLQHYRGNHEDNT